MSETIEVRLIRIPSAQQACDRWHSHHNPPLSGKFAVGAWVGDRCVCVAIVGRPIARALDTGVVLEVVRLASDGSTRGAASAVLRACVREALARGVRRLVSYTLLGEVGACYRAARWRPVKVTRGGQWDTPARRRREAIQPGRKVRWEAGPDALPRDDEAQRAIAQHAGRVELARREASQLGLVGVR